MRFSGTSAGHEALQVAGSVTVTRYVSLSGAVRVNRSKHHRSLGGGGAMVVRRSRRCSDGERQAAPSEGFEVSPSAE